MFDELNDEPEQLRNELSEVDQAAADKARNDAFRQAFGGDDTQSSKQEPAAAENAPADPVAAKPEVSTSSSSDDEDPFKDLHPKVRDMLAEIPDLKRNANALHGRLAPTQQRLSQVERELVEARRQLAERTTAPALDAAPDDELEQRVRGELPEVADLIKQQVERAMGMANKGAKQPTQADPSPVDVQDEGPSAAAKAMTAKHSDWMETMNSTDYKLYLAAQGAEYLETVSGSNDPDVVADSITKFKEHRDRSDERTRASTDAARRDKRTARALTPTGRQAPGGQGAMTPHEAMLAAFNAP